MIATQSTMTNQGQELYNSNTTIRAEAEAEMLKFARASTSVKQKGKNELVFEGGPLAVKLEMDTPKQKKKQEEDDDESDDFLASMWGVPLGVGTGSGSGGNNKTPGNKTKQGEQQSSSGGGGKAASRGGGRGGQKKGPKGGGGVLEASPNKGSNAAAATVTEGKRAKEISYTEQQVLLAEQMIRALSGPVTFRSVMYKTHETLCSKLELRLAASMTSIYLMGHIADGPGNNEGTHEGMKLLKKLRSVKKTLDSLEPLVKSLSDEKVSGCEVIAEFQACKAASIELPDEIAEVGFARHIENLASSKDWNRIAHSLGLRDPPRVLARQGSAASEEEKENRVVLDLLPQHRQQDCQQRMMVKCFVDLTRSDNASADIRALHAAITVGKIKTPAVSEEFADLADIMNPWRAASVEVLEEKRQKFLTNDTLKMHKALTLFPSGCALMDECDKVRLQRMEDIGMEKDLQKVQVPADVVMSDTSLETAKLPNEKGWKKCVSDVAKIRGKNSEQFKETHKRKFETFDGAIDRAAKALRRCAEDSFHSKVAAACGTLTKLSTAWESNTKMAIKRLTEAFKADCDGLVSALPSSATLGLTALHRDYVKNYDDLMEKNKLEVINLQTTVVALSQGASFVDHDGANKVAHMLGGSGKDRSGIFAVPGPEVEQAAEALKGRMRSLILSKMADDAKLTETLVSRLDSRSPLVHQSEAEAAAAAGMLAADDCLVAGLVGNDHMQIWCSKVVNNFLAILDMNVESEPQVTLRQNVTMSVFSVLLAPKVYQIVLTATKLRPCEGPAEAHERITDNAGSLWSALGDVESVAKKIMDAYPVQSALWPNLKYLATMQSSNWSWFSNLASSACKRIGSSALEAFQLCSSDAKSEGLKDLAERVGHEDLTSEAVVTELFASTQLTSAKSLLTQWKTFTNMQDCLDEVRDVFNGIVLQHSTDDGTVKVFNDEALSILESMAKLKHPCLKDPEYKQKVEALSSDYLKVRIVLGILTTFQSLWRQLRTHENRVTLCKSCHGGLTKRNMLSSLPKPLLTLLKKEAGIENDE